MQHVVRGFPSSDWLLTERLSVTQNSSLRETDMIIAFTSAVRHNMYTEIIITHASCTVKDKNQQTTLRNIPGKQGLTYHANCLL